MTDPTSASESLKGQVTLITRPEPQQASLRAAITAHGGQWLSLPLINIVPLSGSELLPARQCVQGLDNYDAIIFISLNAARHGAELIGSLWPQLPVGQEVIAIGKSTASLVADLLACEVISPPSGSDSEAVLALPSLQQLANKRVGIFRGQGGRELLAATLAERGARVDYIEVYRREPVQYGPDTVASIVTPEKLNVIAVHSGESLDTLLSLIDAKLDQVLTLPIVVPSARVARQAQDKGFTLVVDAEGADDDSMIKALERIHSRAD